MDSDFKEAREDQAVLPELNNRLKKKHHELFLATIEKLSRAVELRDTYTGNHSQRVTRFAILLGQQFPLSTG